MRGVLNKRGQENLGMPFGMIFAIFLMIVFIVIAFIAVDSFLDIGNSSGVGMFYRELQDAVDDARRGQSSEAEFDVNLPSGIEKVCFANLSAAVTNPGAEYDAIKDFEVYDANVFLFPPEYGQNMRWKLIKGINVTATTFVKNPYCVDVNDGLIIVKGFYDKLVWIA
jgi:hypothetical protein